MPKRKYKREPLTRAEAIQLADSCTSWIEKAAIYTMIDSGIRLSELCGLTKANVDFQSDRLVIYGKGRENPDSTIMTKRRVVCITPRTRAVLEALFAIHDKFPLKQRAVQNLVKGVARRSGVTRKITPHILRHTFAVSTLQKGMSLAGLQKLLGHENLNTTALYLNLSNEEAIREFEDKITKKHDR